jgi:hypothetical protein
VVLIIHQVGSHGMDKIMNVSIMAPVKKGGEKRVMVSALIRLGVVAVACLLASVLVARHHHTTTLVLVLEASPVIPFALRVGGCLA